MHHLGMLVHPHNWNENFENTRTSTLLSSFNMQTVNITSLHYIAEIPKHKTAPLHNIQC